MMKPLALICHAHSHVLQSKKVCFALRLYYSAVLLCDSLLCSLFFFHLVVSEHEWGPICPQCFVAISYSLLSAGYFTSNKCWKLRERETKTWAWPFSSSLIFLSIELFSSLSTYHKYVQVPKLFYSEHSFTWHWLILKLIINSLSAL